MKKLLRRHRGFFGFLLLLAVAAVLVDLWENRSRNRIKAKDELTDNCELWQKAKFVPLSLSSQKGVAFVAGSDVRIHVGNSDSVSMLVPHHYGQKGQPIRCFKSKLIQADRLDSVQVAAGRDHSLETLLKKNGPYLEVYERGCVQGKCNYFTTNEIIAVDIDWYRQKRSKCPDIRGANSGWCISDQVFN